MQHLVNLVDEGRTGRPRARAAVVGLAVFTVAFLCQAFLLRALTPLYVEHDALSEKFRHLAQHRDRYDTLFIGSSYVYRGIMPNVFDAVTQANSVPTTSFNFGMRGMRGLETEFVLERILALEPRNLRWVLIEPNDVADRTQQRNWKGERFVVWHDVPHTLLALDLLVGGDRPGYDLRSWMREHLPPLVRRVLAPGRGAAWIRKLRESDDPGLAYEGFLALDTATSPDMEARHASFLARIDRFREKTALVASGLDTEQRELEPFERRHLARLGARVEDAGARVIFLVAPVPHLRNQYVVRAAVDGVVPVTFNYADPERYPEFYDPALHFDMGHFNRTGARRFTERLAADFVRYARGEGPPSDGPWRVAGSSLRTESR